MGLIGAEFSPKEATSIYEVAGDALALKHSVQVHAWEEETRGLLTTLKNNTAV